MNIAHHSAEAAGQTDMAPCLGAPASSTARREVKQAFAGEGAGDPRQCAFTLLELAVIIAIVALLAVTLLPVMAKSHPNTLAFQCLNNNRRLCNAWRMYADDNHDRMVLASDDGSTANTNPLNQYAWTLSHLDYSPNNSGNWDTNVDIVVRPLWPYTGRDATIYKCPADRSTVMTSSGVAKPRVRSFSMNVFLGGFGGSTGGIPSMAPYRLFFKTTDLTSPGPAKTLVFLEERWDLINWGSYLIDMTGYSPSNPAQYEFDGDFPGFIHDLACSLSFGDGHTELHRWRDARTIPPLYLDPLLPTIASPRNQDIAWLQDHATRPK